MKLPPHVFLDLETTGATPLKDRITEIALIREKMASLFFPYRGVQGGDRSLH